MIKNRHTTFACLLVILFGLALFYFGTDGFQAFTAETARVNKLIDDKPKFPDVTFEDSKGRKYSIEEFEGKYVFITFLYTSCTTVCPQLEMNMSKVYDKVPSKYIGKDIVFLSISFDPGRDDPATLEKYRTYFNSDGETWRMARIKNKVELDSLLKAFGVIVIPDDNGSFAHNSAFYLVDKKGTLLNVMDYKKVDEAANKLTGILEKGARE
ncbi:SCO family protein [Neobacillus sp. MM2021_6]|uniref:SCO family protein n=1 Tax=Bacillaceae TaxID=186817 RepID=UPI00140B639C|nr:MULTISPECIES: SCO family protein [Bacillaceae]MBO0962622.1 SCO family protein [Neobacillus sp. MM2021_6]NHC21203.1 SCO family protein [Bacillus sp. MM2020_4]WML38483.1 SCO family protein [Neobacillus sp. OS1-2]